MLILYRNMNTINTFKTFYKIKKTFIAKVRLDNNLLLLIIRSKLFSETILHENKSTKFDQKNNSKVR